MTDRTSPETETPLTLIDKRLADLREANDVFRTHSWDRSSAIARNEREISWLRDLRSGIVLCGYAQTTKEPVGWRWWTGSKWALSSTDPGPLAGERQPLYADSSTDRCAKCNYPRAEHSYNGACYGLCGEFVPPVSSPEGNTK
jgi:hypothetical protein